MRLRTALLSSVRPLASSCGVNSLGTMSSSSTSTPILAKWHAMRDPITPEPNTATFVIRLFSIVSCLMSKVSNPLFRFILDGQLIHAFQGIDEHAPFVSRNVFIQVGIELAHNVLCQFTLVAPQFREVYFHGALVGTVRLPVNQSQCFQIIKNARQTCCLYTQ